MSTPQPSPRKVEVEEDPQLVAQCPHCDAALATIRTRRLHTSGRAKARFGTRYVYACPDCNRLLGISHRKGFWMG